MAILQHCALFIMCQSRTHRYCHIGKRQIKIICCSIVKIVRCFTYIHSILNVIEHDCQFGNGKLPTRTYVLYVENIIAVIYVRIRQVHTIYILKLLNLVYTTIDTSINAYLNVCPNDPPTCIRLYSYDLLSYIKYTLSNISTLFEWSSFVKFPGELEKCYGTPERQ